MPSRHSKSSVEHWLKHCWKGVTWSCCISLHVSCPHAARSVVPLAPGWCQWVSPLRTLFGLDRAFKSNSPCIVCAAFPIPVCSCFASVGARAGLCFDLKAARAEAWVGLGLFRKTWRTLGWRLCTLGTCAFCFLCARYAGLVAVLLWLRCSVAAWPFRQRFFIGQRAWH